MQYNLTFLWLDLEKIRFDIYSFWPLGALPQIANGVHVHVPFEELCIPYP